MPRLFEKTQIKNMELKNRLVRSATHEGMSDENGFPGEALFKLYERLARGGVGLIITGYAFVSRAGDPEPSRCAHCNLCMGYLANRPLRCYHGKRLK